MGNLWTILNHNRGKAMTDLTKKYQNYELPEGVYYVTYPKNDTPEIDIYRRVFSLYDESEIRFTIPSVEKVLKKVPSYEEWQASENYIDYLKQCISVYESKDKQATETSIAYNELLEENTQLKEQINHLSKTQARQFADNQKLQVKAGKAKDVVNIDTARQIIQLKDLLEECRECVDENLEFSKSIGRNRIHPRNKGLLKRIDEVLK